jgi:hypothetical protein
MTPQQYASGGIRVAVDGTLMADHVVKVSMI